MPVRVDPKRLKRKRKRGMAPPSGADNQDLVVSLLRKILRTILNKSWGERSSESHHPLAPGIFACAWAQSL
jgi:hypothetical protein